MNKPEPGQQIRIKKVHHMGLAEGEQTYEIDPVLYSGPWRLPEGTVLEIVKIPKTSTQGC